MYYLKLYGLTTVVLFAIDLVWIGVVAQGFYQRHMGSLLRSDVRWVPAVSFYLLYVAALLVFVVLPALEAGSLGRAIGMGAFFGLVAFATYDLTNLALAEGFPGIVAAVDMMWGTAFTAVMCGISYKFGEWLA